MCLHGSFIHGSSCQHIWIITHRQWCLKAALLYTSTTQLPYSHRRVATSVLVNQAATAMCSVLHMYMQTYTVTALQSNLTAKDIWSHNNVTIDTQFMHTSSVHMY
ncbi:hypothetical protein NP493_56g00032 [Ridgeia piscesae]|uniref:Uncharacterized protein n=1 Tax=Ridgeia piscesae TaxID=27915 RepID=A0AAD9PAM9_RIDPI|nr:hypothetical protein NP493_56g00032 [Ridgeia piscesae]